MTEAKSDLTQAIKDIVNGHTVLDDPTRFAIHESLADMQHLEALENIAASTLQITAIYAKTSPALQMLHTECTRIVSNMKEQEPHIKCKAKWLEHIQSDFGTLANLLELNCDFLAAKDKTASQLCHILGIQAKSQIDITGEVLRLLSMEPSKRTGKIFPARKNNIVPFKPGENVQASRI